TSRRPARCGSSAAPGPMGPSRRTGCCTSAASSRVRRVNLRPPPRQARARRPRYPTEIDPGLLLSLTAERTAMAIASDAVAPNVSVKYRNSTIDLVLVHLGVLLVFWVGVSWAAVTAFLVAGVVHMFAMTAGMHRY